MAASVFTAFALALTLAQASEPEAPEAPGMIDALTQEMAAFLAVQNPDGPFNDMANFIDGAAAAFLTEHAIPGLIVSVVSDDEVWAAGYGYSDLEAWRPADGYDVRFEIGSVSKTFIWTAVMMLEAEGVLDLHEDVNVYLTGFQAGRGGEPITLAQLMSHRAGLEDSFGIFLPRYAALDRPEALARTEPRQVAPRGADTAYSNWGSALAAQVVEDASGLSYADFLYQRILEPLGMEDTTLLEGDARGEQPSLSVSYHVRSGAHGAAQRLDIGAFGPAGSMASTAADMARWMKFHLQGGALDGVRLMPAETHARMLTRLYDDRPGAADIAHGFMHWRVGGVDVYGHGGSLNEFLTMMAFAPELGAGVFVSQNAAPSFTPSLHLPDLVLGRMLTQAGHDWRPGEAPEDAAERAREAAGRYIANRRPHSGVERMFSAAAVISVTAHEDGALTLASAQGAEGLAPVGEDLWMDRHGGLHAALRGPDGSVTRLTSFMGVHTYERVGVSTDPNLLFAAMGLALLVSVTTWLGLWRRLAVPHGPGRSVSVRGRAVSVFNLAAASLVIVFLVMVGAAAGELSNFSLELMADYPPPMLRAAMALAGAVTVAAVLAVLACVPAFAMSGWSVWRKIHHGLFALALGFLAWALVTWGLAFGGHAGG